MTDDTIKCPLAAMLILDADIRPCHTLSVLCVDARYRGADAMSHTSRCDDLSVGRARHDVAGDFWVDSQGVQPAC